MQFLTTTLLLALPALSLATTKSCSTSTICYTKYESTSVKRVATKYTTSYFPCTSTNSVTKTCTVTSASTKTETKFVTSTSTGPTNVMTETSTVVDTETNTETLTPTVTAVTTTSTTSTATSTSATPFGFVPVQSSLPGATYDGSAGGSPVRKRSVDRRVSVNEKVKVLQSFLRNKGKPKTHPAGVLCVVNRPAKKCQVKQVTTTVTVTACPTVTATTTSTAVVTEFPSATTTVTVSQTVTTASTTTAAPSTTTATVTLTVITQTTVVAACATNNFANAVGGSRVVSITGTYDNAEVFSASNAYECCVNALALTEAGGSAVWGFTIAPDGSPSCSAAYISRENTATCGGSLANPLFATLSDDVRLVYTFGNGYCGAVTRAS